jgi:transposase
MQKKNKRPNFKSQDFYIGLDVHKKNWTTTIRSGGIVIKTMSMNPSPNELRNYMEKHYPGGNYHSVYEAGFCGYWIHRELEGYGFDNKIVAPINIPTSVSEKVRKTDPVDSRKLARNLENGELKGIYIMTQLQQELRSLVRMRYQIIKSQTRLKNQIKGYINFYGHKLPENYKLKNWSRNFIEHLRELDFNYPIGKVQLNLYLDDLQAKRKLLLKTVKTIRDYLKEYNLLDDINLLCSVPGVGFATALTLLSEIMDPRRFSKFDNLASYAGLVPAIRSSSEKETVLGLKFHHNKYIRQLLVEASWIAIRKDPALTLAYSQYSRRMKKQKAIIRIAKKLLSRINYVWQNKKKYECSVAK